MVRILCICVPVCLSGVYLSLCLWCSGGGKLSGVLDKWMAVEDVNGSQHCEGVSGV